MSGAARCLLCMDTHGSWQAPPSSHTAFPRMKQESMSTSAMVTGKGDTIIAVARSRRLRSLTHNFAELQEVAERKDAEFKIRLANTEGRRSQASYLIKRRYGWRGYQVSPLAGAPADRITLAAFDGETSIATITIGLDSSSGLSVESLYPDEVKMLRASGASLCEFTKLAVDNMVRSKPVLAAIFHIAYIHAHRIRLSTDLLIEVNPRHVKFYQSMLGFTVCGAEKLDPKVNAPALLLRLELSHAEAEIARLGGRRELADSIRSLYPFFFSQSEERGIEGRLLSLG
jgi:hypothetical protein